MTVSVLGAFRVDNAHVEIYPSKLDASLAAAAKAATILTPKRHAPDRRVRIVVGTGNSQEDLVKALVQTPSIDWSRIEVFHMDEYIGISAAHPASFRRWVKTQVADKVNPFRVHYLNGDSQDLEEECRRYESALRSNPIDVCFLGFGENGHIAFNDPHTADFNDPLIVKRATLDKICRLQQVHEGHFPDLNAVPKEALTITCSFLMSAKYLICCVPELRKAEAVRAAIEGPLSPSCPASLVRNHPRAFVFLDSDSASLLAVPLQKPEIQGH